MKRLILLGLLFLPLVGCSGSGAVNPLSPANATKADASSSADSDVIYWSNFPLEKPVTDSINAICLINKKLGWACGNNGLVMQYDGQTWNKVQIGLAPNENFMTVGFLNENEGWIAGTHGVILHYYNGQWTQDNSPTTEILYGIAITRSRTVWLVGSNGAILTYNGISWGTIIPMGGTAAAPTTVTSDIYSVGLSDQNNGWAVGNLGLILKFDGQKWTSYSASPTTERLNSISVISDVQAWAVGAYGTILNFNGTTWSKVANAFSGFDLYSIAMIDDSDGWLSGQDGTIAFYDGTRWISHVKPENKPSLNAIAFYKDLGFMVGQNGTFIKFQKGGVPDKFDITFKGLVTDKPTQIHPYWTLTYSLLNESPKTTAALDFVLPIPKGFEPYQPKATPTALVEANSTPVPTVAPATPTPTATTGSSSTPTAKTAAAGVAVTGEWKMKDGNLVWEIGTITTAESKTIKILLASKKGEKKEYPVVLNASLRTIDRTIADAAPVTLLVSEPIPESTATVTMPVSTPHTSPDSANTQGETGATPTIGN